MARQRKESRSKKGTAGIDTALHLNFSTGAIYDLSPSTKKVFDYKYIEPVAKAYKITTSGEKYYLAEPGGQPQRLSTPTLYDGVTYEFDFSDSSMVNRKFRVSTSWEGTHEGGAQYTQGWSEVGTPGSSGAKATFSVVDNAASAVQKLYYYDSNEDGWVGASSSTDEGFLQFKTAGQVNFSTGVLKSQSNSAYFSGNAGIFISGQGYEEAYDLNLINDFTISFWAKSSATGYSGTQCLFDFGLLTGFVESGTRSYIAMPTGWSGTNLDIKNQSNVNFTEWNHFCLMRVNNFLRYYINGTGQGKEILFTGDVSPLSNSSSGEYYSIGSTRNYDKNYSGYMDDFFVHNVAIYGRNGFEPMVEDVSGKFYSIARDGLSAKHNAYKIYLMSDGGYRQFEMYDTDSLYFKLPPTGNIIPKDNTDNKKQYIYPFSGQNCIISFYKDPDIIDVQNSAINFYLDSGDGRKMMATDSGLGYVYTNSLDSHFDNVKLLVESSLAAGSRESFYDYSNKDYSISRPGTGYNYNLYGTGHIINTEEQFRSLSAWPSDNANSSISFPGLKYNHLTVESSSSSNDFNWGSGEWTIDSWVKISGSGNANILSKCSSGESSTGCSFKLTTDPSGYVSFDRKDTISGCGGSIVSVTTTNPIFHSGETGWNLISVQRNNTRNQIEIFINGGISGSGNIDSNAALCTSNSQDFVLGDFYGTWSGMSEQSGIEYPSGQITGVSHTGTMFGWMDSTRVTKDVARYSENFVRPSGRFANRNTNRQSTISYSPLGSSYRTAPPNRLGVTTSLKPQEREISSYISTGDVSVNASHLIINNIQPGYTGTWSAELVEGDRVYSTPRDVVIKDVIGGTGCVRPAITGMDPRGQIMSLANPWRNCTNCSDTEKPQWTGNCLETSSVSDIHLYPHNHTTGICGPYGWTHYRIFSGWLEGDSLPAFDVVSGTRYDGSTDNSNLLFIVSEQPIGGASPRVSSSGGCYPGDARWPTASTFGDYRLYKEFTFNEISGLPVQTFSYMNSYNGEFVETSGRLLITGNGNKSSDNAVYGETCVYMTVVDKIAKDNCYISKGEERITCLQACPKFTRCSDYAKCNADPDCVPCVPGPPGGGGGGGGKGTLLECGVGQECPSRCGEQQYSGPGYSFTISGWYQNGYSSYQSCVDICGGSGETILPLWGPIPGGQSPNSSMWVDPGEKVMFHLDPPLDGESAATWYKVKFSQSEYEQFASPTSGFKLPFNAEYPSGLPLSEVTKFEQIFYTDDQEESYNVYYPVWGPAGNGINMSPFARQFGARNGFGVGILGAGITTPPRLPCPRMVNKNIFQNTQINLPAGTNRIFSAASITNATAWLWTVGTPVQTLQMLGNKFSNGTQTFITNNSSIWLNFGLAKQGTVNFVSVEAYNCQKCKNAWDPNCWNKGPKITWAVTIVPKVPPTAGACCLGRKERYFSVYSPGWKITDIKTVATWNDPSDVTKRQEYNSVNYGGDYRNGKPLAMYQYSNLGYSGPASFPVNINNEQHQRWTVNGSWNFQVGLGGNNQTCFHGSPSHINTEWTQTNPHAPAGGTCGGVQPGQITWKMRGCPTKIWYELEVVRTADNKKAYLVTGEEQADYNTNDKWHIWPITFDPEGGTYKRRSVHFHYPKYTADYTEDTVDNYAADQATIDAYIQRRPNWWSTDGQERHNTCCQATGGLYQAHGGDNSAFQEITSFASFPSQDRAGFNWAAPSTHCDFGAYFYRHAPIPTPTRTFLAARSFTPSTNDVGHSIEISDASDTTNALNSTNFSELIATSYTVSGRVNFTWSGHAPNSSVNLGKYWDGSAWVYPTSQVGEYSRTPCGNFENGCSHLKPVGGYDRSNYNLNLWSDVQDWNVIVRKNTAANVWSSNDPGGISQYRFYMGWPAEQYYMNVLRTHGIGVSKNGGTPTVWLGHSYASRANQACSCSSQVPYAYKDTECIHNWLLGPDQAAGLGTPFWAGDNDLATYHEDGWAYFGNNTEPAAGGNNVEHVANCWAVPLKTLAGGRPPATCYTWAGNNTPYHYSHFIGDPQEPCASDGVTWVPFQAPSAGRDLEANMEPPYIPVPNMHYRRLRGEVRNMRRMGRKADFNGPAGNENYWDEHQFVGHDNVGFVGPWPAPKIINLSTSVNPWPTAYGHKWEFNQQIGSTKRTHKWWQVLDAWATSQYTSAEVEMPGRYPTVGDDTWGVDGGANNTNFNQNNPKGDWALGWKDRRRKIHLYHAESFENMDDAAVPPNVGKDPHTIFAVGKIRLDREVSQQPWKSDGAGGWNAIANFNEYPTGDETAPGAEIDDENNINPDNLGGGLSHNGYHNYYTQRTDLYFHHKGNNFPLKITHGCRWKGGEYTNSRDNTEYWITGSPYANQVTKATYAAAGNRSPRPEQLYNGGKMNDEDPLNCAEIQMAIYHGIGADVWRKTLDCNGQKRSLDAEPQSIAGSFSMTAGGANFTNAHHYAFGGNDHRNNSIYDGEQDHTWKGDDVDWDWYNADAGTAGQVVVQDITKDRIRDAEILIKYGSREGGEHTTTVMPSVNNGEPLSRDKDLMFVVHPGDDLWYETPETHNSAQGWNSFAAGYLFVNREPVKIPCDRDGTAGRPAVRTIQGGWQSLPRSVNSAAPCSNGSVDTNEEGFKYTWKNHAGAVEVPEYVTNITANDEFGNWNYQYFGEDDGESSLSQQRGNPFGKPLGGIR